MTTGDTLVTLHLPHSSGLVKDEVQIGFAFGWSGGSGPTTSDYDNLLGDCINFFTTTNASGHKLGDRIAGTMARTALAASAKAYDIAGHLDGSDHGSPIRTQLWTLPTAGGYKPLPQEVALCLSFASSLAGLAEVGPLVSDIPSDHRAQAEGAPATHAGHTKPKARRRGRVYVGPFTENELGSTTTDNAPAGALQNDLGEAAGRLSSQTLAHTWQWCVWSRRNAALHPVLSPVWVDNDWDVQRRRGQTHKTKTVYTI